MTPLLLASASTARAEMLRRAGVPVQIEPARIDEAAVKKALLAENVPPRDQADALAELKAARISGKHTERLTLGADQILVADDTCLDKPADLAEARAQLAWLRGRRHRLMSAAVIMLNAAPVWRHIGTAELTMRPFTDAFLDDYVAQAGEALLGSVGAYQLEGLGAQLFAKVEGDYFTVLGLPLLELLGFLRARKVLVE